MEERYRKLSERSSHSTAIANSAPRSSVGHTREFLADMRFTYQVCAFLAALCTLVGGHEGSSRVRGEFSFHDSSSSRALFVKSPVSDMSRPIGCWFKLCFPVGRAFLVSGRIQMLGNYVHEN